MGLRPFNQWRTLSSRTDNRRANSALVQPIAFSTANISSPLIGTAF
jgi:hypothetical protein